MFLYGFNRRGNSFIIPLVMNLLYIEFARLKSNFKKKFLLTWVSLCLQYKQTTQPRIYRKHYNTVRTSPQAPNLSYQDPQVPCSLLFVTQDLISISEQQFFLIIFVAILLMRTHCLVCFSCLKHCILFTDSKRRPLSTSV